MFTKFTKKIIIFSVAVMSFQSAIAVRHKRHGQRINRQAQAFNQDNLNHEQREVFRNEPPVIQQNRAEDNQNNLNVDNLTDEQRAERGLFHNEPPVIQQNRAEDNQNNLNDEQRAQDNPALSFSESLRQYRLHHYNPMLEDILQNPLFGHTIDNLKLENMPGKDVAIILDIREQGKTIKKIDTIPTNYLNDLRNEVLESASLRKSMYIVLEGDQRGIWLAEIDSGFPFLRFHHFIDPLMLIKQKIANLWTKTLNYVAEALK